MTDSVAPRLSRWPFIVGDVLMLGTAFFIGYQSKFVLGHWELCFVVLCVLGGALMGIAPFVLEYDALVKVAEAGELNTAMAQLKNLDGIANQITGATAKWQDAHEQAGQTVVAARDIADRMTGEVKSFTEFMKRANDSERATLRLEVEKLRRAEAEWLQVLVRTLDHVYALHQGAERSEQPALVEQVGNFQMACRDAARRVGLTPFAPKQGDAYNAQQHQLFEEGATAPPNARVTETVATGYTFQGRLLRPALVRLRENVDEAILPNGEAAPADQSQLTLGAVSPGAQ